MIKACDISIGYDENLVVSNLNLDIHKGEIISIIGPNGSGKSTILKVMSRLMKAEKGSIYLDGSNMNEIKTKDIAKKLSILSQHNLSPEDFNVEDLIFYGRVPHKKWLEGRNREDESIVNWAIERTNLSELRNKKICNLSGGERQRAWIAMALAQKPKVLLLDEPTTYLDICHQLEVMELIQNLNKEVKITIVMVLHDLNQAAKYSHRIYVLKKGNVVAEGKPEKVLTKELIKDVYNVDADIFYGNESRKPIIVPKSLKIS